MKIILDTANHLKPKEISMRYLPYPQSCAARTIVEFGNTAVGFDQNDTTVEEIDAFLKKTRATMTREKNTFCSAVLNNDQAKLFHQTFIDNGWACIQQNRWHPKYGRSVSFYLLTMDWGVNKGFKNLEIADGQPFAVAP